MKSIIPFYLIPNIKIGLRTIILLLLFVCSSQLALSQIPEIKTPKAATIKPNLVIGNGHNMNSAMPHSYIQPTQTDYIEMIMKEVEHNEAKNQE